MAVANIVYAVTHPSEISSIVSMTTDEDEIMAETGSEDLSDEEYAKRLNEEGGK